MRQTVMDTKQQQAFDIISQQIQQRWGQDALQQLGTLRRTTTQPAIPSGYPELDQVLSAQGILRGSYVELQGAATSGKTTLALTCAVSAQEAGEIVAYIDPAGKLDPAYAAQCGLDLEQLLFVRPDTPQLPELVYDIVCSGVIGVIIVGTSYRGDGCLSHMLRKFKCTLMCLTDTQSEQATLRLAFKRQGWQIEQGELQGYQTLVTVRKQKGGSSGQQVLLNIPLIGSSA